MSVICCPHCGEPAFPVEQVQFAGYSIDYQERLCTPDGRKIKLPRRGVRKLLSMLLAAEGRPVSRWAMMDAQYGLLNEGEEPDDRIIDVRLTGLRKALRDNDVPLQVVNVWGAGWCLEVSP